MRPLLPTRILHTADDFQVAAEQGFDFLELDLTHTDTEDIDDIVQQAEDAGLKIETIHDESTGAMELQDTEPFHARVEELQGIAADCQCSNISVRPPSALHYDRKLLLQLLEELERSLVDTPFQLSFETHGQFANVAVLNTIFRPYEHVGLLLDIENLSTVTARINQIIEALEATVHKVHLSDFIEELSMRKLLLGIGDLDLNKFLDALEQKDSTPLVVLDLHELSERDLKLSKHTYEQALFDRLRL